MAESRLCLICGAVVDSSKLSVHREFHAEVTALRRVTDDLRTQIRRLESRLTAAAVSATGSATSTATPGATPTATTSRTPAG